MSNQQPATSDKSIEELDTDIEAQLAEVERLEKSLEHPPVKVVRLRRSQMSTGVNHDAWCFQCQHCGTTNHYTPKFMIDNCMIDSGSHRLVFAVQCANECATNRMNGGKRVKPTILCELPVKLPIGVIP